MTDDVTTLENARVFKRMGVPLNTPVVKRTFSREYSRHWFALTEAHEKFERTMAEFVGTSPRAGSPGKWQLVKRRLMALDKAAVRCVEFACARPDEHERAMMFEFLKSRAEPFILFWAGALDAVDAGAELTINPGDVPVWFDEQT